MISQALLESGVLIPGKYGLGFGVSKEPLPSLFASFGCNITVTDQIANEETLKEWEIVVSCKALNDRNICSQELFDNLVEFYNVDMKNIPKSLFEKYDFIWSSWALEHIDTLQDGLDFIYSSLNCLKPGGWAIHTTEYNISSNDHTLVSKPCVYRRCDIEAMKKKLEKDGNYVEFIDFERGDMEFDRYIDKPPYGDSPHINLAVDDLTNATSIIIMVRKGYSSIP